MAPVLLHNTLADADCVRLHSLQVKNFPKLSKAALGLPWKLLNAVNNHTWLP